MNRVLFNVCGFYPFFPLCFSLISPLRLVCLVWYKIIQSSPLHTTFPLLFFSTSPPVTLLSSSENPPSSLSSSHYCVAVCGWASVLSSSSPSFLGEGAYALGARGGNSPARRGDWGETLLVSRSADNLPVCAKGPQKYNSTTSAGFYHVLLIPIISGNIESSF